jgi:hypothetical protein
VTLLFLVHFAATLYMTGVIWVVQVLHYPMLGRVGPAFDDCQSFHLAKTGFVVGPPMLAEAVTAVLLVWQHAHKPMLWAGLGLLIAIWLSTALVQVPQHNRLKCGWDARTHTELVKSNWVRTWAWTARSLLLVIFSASTQLA